MITLEQAIELATEAHKEQWRNPYTVTSYTWDKYKPKTEFIDVNGNKVVWCDGDTFLVYEPYITHPLAVMNMMDTEEEKIVAVLHDVFEDSTAQLCNYNKQYNFNEKVYSIKFEDKTYPITANMWAALYTLIKPNSDWTKFKEKGHYQSYQGYIKDLTLNRIATKVKIADIVQNLSCSPSKHAKEKYLKAIPVLLK